MDRILYLKKMVEASRDKTGDARYGFKSFHGVYLELAKMELLKNEETVLAIDYKNMDRGLDHITNRQDCADFIIPAYVRILMEHRNMRYMDPEYCKRIEMCFWDSGIGWMNLERLRDATLQKTTRFSFTVQNTWSERFFQTGYS